MAEEGGIAPQSEAPTGEAGRHSRRGAELYGEANYAAALVEFKRAYALGPTAASLYNVGETQFQLQDFAGALKTFRRFLADFGPNESRRAAVARAVEQLRTHVGHLSVTTVPPGADVVIDDETVGKTPLPEPLLVSVGRRKVVASMPGRAAVTEYVDMAAEDHVSISLQLSGAAAKGPPPPKESPSWPAAAPPLETAGGNGATALRTAGWITAGSLAAGAITFGALALGSSQALANARNTFPAMSSVLNHDASRTATFSILADSFAAAALIAGAASLYWTLTPAVDHAAALSPQARVTLSPASARFEMTF
jgi:hypothetical protein